jgi:hypothetical protein
MRDDLTGEDLPPVPIPPEHISGFAYPWVLSVTGETWRYGDGTGWLLLGVLPVCDPVSIDPATLGEVKAQFRE